MVPIVLTSYNRADSLQRTIDSLVQTVWPPEPTRLIVYDDSSTEPETIRVLDKFADDARLTSQDVEVIYNWPPDCRLGPHVNTVMALQQTFLRFPDSHGVISIENDLVFNPDWLTRLLGLVWWAGQPTSDSTAAYLEGSRIAVCSAYNSVLHPPLRDATMPVAGPFGADDYHLKHATGGGHACYYPRWFWVGMGVMDRFIKQYRAVTWTRLGWDEAPVRVAMEHDCVYACLCPSAVDHLGQEGGSSPAACREHAADFTEGAP